MAQRYAAFLRGINVGGHRVKGPELAAAFESVDGITTAKAYLASGNVAFTDQRRRRTGTVAAKLERAIASRFGWEAKTFLREPEELAEITVAEPFSGAQLEASAGKHQVILLGAEPNGAERRHALALATENDLLALQGPNLHWLPSGGYADSELDLDALSSILGPGTTRTRNTLVRMHTKFFAGDD